MFVFPVGLMLSKTLRIACSAAVNARHRSATVDNKPARQGQWLRPVNHDGL
jgi:hypothetical protein